MEFVTGKRQVVMNFSEKFCKTEVEVLNSECFKEVWTRYVEGLYKSENQAFLPVQCVDLMCSTSAPSRSICSLISYSFVYRRMPVSFGCIGSPP